MMNTTPESVQYTAVNLRYQVNEMHIRFDMHEFRWNSGNYRPEILYLQNFGRFLFIFIRKGEFSC